MPVLSYDVTTLDDDQAAGRAYLTDDYRKKYDELFGVLRANGDQTGTKVSTKVVSSGIVRSGEDRVEVLLFVDRPTTNKQQTEPVVYKDQVRVTMELVGDEWLIDTLETSPSGSPDQQKRVFRLTAGAAEFIIVRNEQPSSDPAPADRVL